MKTRTSRWMTWILAESATVQPAAPFARAAHGGARAATRAHALRDAAAPPAAAPHRAPRHERVPA